MKRWAVVADDLTGAGDTGVQFVKQGLRTTVCLSLDDISAQADYDVLVVNTDSRAMPGGMAYETLTLVAKRLKEAGVSAVYKKIDSTFRGNVAEEVDALSDEFGFDLALVAPSFPANGRTVVGGYLLVNGEIVSRTPFGQDPVAPVTQSHLPSLLSSRSRYPVGYLPISAVSRGPEHVAETLRKAAGAGERTVVADAITPADLESIVAGATLTGLRTMFVGSAGLALPVAKSLARSPRCEPAAPILVVCGSVNPRSREQVEALLGKSGWAAITVDVLGWMKDPETWANEMDKTSGSLAAGELQGIVLQTPGRPEDVARVKSEASRMGIPQKDVGRRVSEALAAGVHRLLRAWDAAGFVLTGGDTAASVLRSLGSSGIELESEVSPGVPVGRIAGGPYGGRPVVTKAGGFGGKDVLCEAVKVLQDLR